MAEMRDGFRDIVDGWMLISGMEDITDRIERAAEWTKVNGPLWPDERATISMMIECQVARGIVGGDFEPFIAGGDEDLAHRILRSEPPDNCPDCGSPEECLPGCPSRLP